MKNEAAVALGKRGGSVKSEAKSAAARINALKAQAARRKNAALRREGKL